ncbi:MAG TPA: hypothetical protein GX391_01865 [Firmicutes bacterium]|mgnify:CR=1 FL=1|jgi:hypothetical protein|nr:hypothetical protein [Bacillota bacterium]HOQ24233.1 hypothetical protein [Bacillota bacterium]HPT67607.1 hypothetical protein [Bacillota bacterium]
MKENRNERELRWVLSSDESFALFLEEVRSSSREDRVKELGWQTPEPNPALVRQAMRRIRTENELMANPRILGAAAGLAVLLLAGLMVSITHLFPTADGSSVGLFWLVVSLSLCGIVPNLVLNVVREDHTGTAWGLFRRELK